MKEEIMGLINAIAAQDSVAIQDQLNSVMAQKTMDALDDKRIDLAQNMFKQATGSAE